VVASHAGCGELCTKESIFVISAIGAAQHVHALV
jgi:hypothetical protein